MGSGCERWSGVSRYSREETVFIYVVTIVMIVYRTATNKVHIPIGRRVAPQSEGGNINMSVKILSTAIVAGLVLAFSAPAFAEDAPAPTTKADCDKAKGTWDDATSKCTVKK